MESNKKIKPWVSITILAIILFAFISWIIPNSSEPNNKPIQNQEINQKKSVYKTEEKDLRTIIGSIPDAEFGSLDVEMLDVRYALSRVTNKPIRIYDLPFYAIKDPQSDGFIGVIVHPTGEALFLVTPKALNDTEMIDLERSIEAINGTAKTFNNNLQFAGESYNPFEILKLINN